MPLNFGSIINRKDIPDYADVLQSDLDYKEAYQDFINYKNICEIVIKADKSEEKKKFAEDLLGCSLESLNISKELLEQKEDFAFELFEKSWNTFYDWSTYILDNFKDILDLEESLEVDQLGHFNDARNRRMARYQESGYTSADKIDKKDATERRYKSALEYKNAVILVPFTEDELNKIYNLLKEASIKAANISLSALNKLREELYMIPEKSPTEQRNSIYAEKPLGRKDLVSWGLTAKKVVGMINTMLVKRKKSLSLIYRKTLEDIKRELTKYLRKFERGRRLLVRLRAAKNK